MSSSADKESKESSTNTSSSHSPRSSETLLSFKNEQEVLDYCQKKPDLKWVIFEGDVFDVMDYLPLHPGGSDMIDPYIGMSIDEPFEEQGHSKSAKRMFSSFNKVGVICSKDVSKFENSD